jgi:TRAP transporter TAXI family solute receptor
MPSIGRRAFLAFFPGMTLVGPAVAHTPKIRLGTALEGGGFFMYSVAFIDTIRSVDPTLEIIGVPTEGTDENVSQLESGELDIGLVSGEVAHELFTGIGRPKTRLKVITAMYPTPGMFVVRADSRYHSIDDLRGQRVVLNGHRSDLATQARYLLDGLGLDIEKDFTPVYIKRLFDGPRLVIEGEAAALWGGGLRWPGFVAVANAPMGARFVVPSTDEINRIRAKHSFLAQLTVPAGLYPGQHQSLETVGTWSFVLARADLDDAIGFRLAEALGKAERMGQLPKQLAETTTGNTLNAISSVEMLQPGVARYYKTAGLLP